MCKKILELRWYLEAAFESYATGRSIGEDCCLRKLWWMFGLGNSAAQK